jgi:hypothetical protein
MRRLDVQTGSSDGSRRDDGNSHGSYRTKSH